MPSTGAWSLIGGATPRLHHELEFANCSRRAGRAGVVSPTRRALVAREGDFPTGTRVRLRCLCQVAAERRQGLGTRKDADRRSAEPGCSGGVAPLPQAQEDDQSEEDGSDDQRARHGACDQQGD